MISKNFHDMKWHAEFGAEAARWEKNSFAFEGKTSPGGMTLSLQPQAATVLDAHGESELIILLSGEISISSNGEKVSLSSPGDLCYLSPNEQHTVISESDLVATFVSLYWFPEEENV